MSDCQKCIHEDVCDQASRQMWSRMSGETNCSDFKDRAKYAEVRRGRWKEASGGRIICNNCGHYPLHDYFGRQRLSFYCWHCGVKMYGGCEDERND